MKKKAQLILQFIGIVIILTSLFYFSYSFLSKEVNFAEKKIVNYYIQNTNENVQLIKQGFEKTALFWGVMKTTDELASSGGVSKNTVSNVVGNPVFFCPSMEFANTGGQDIIKWGVIGDNKLLKRIPFLYLMDRDKAVGSITIPILNEAQHETYMDEVKKDVYNLHVIVHVLFLKEGTVEMEFVLKDKAGVVLKTTDFNLLNPAPFPLKSTLTTTDKDGIYYSAKLDTAFITDSKGSVELNVVARNVVDGSIEPDVASIKQVAVSIYDKDVVLDPNTIITGHLTTPKANLDAELAGLNKDDIINIEVGDFAASFSRKTPSYISPVSAMMWSSDDKGIVATVEDPYDGTKDIIKIRSRGLIDEDIYVRYWYLYDAGNWFVNSMDGLVKARIWESLNTLDDYDSSVRTVCGVPSCHPLVFDDTTSYKKGDIINALSSGLSTLTTDLNAVYKPNGIEWSVSVVANILDANELTNGGDTNNPKLKCTTISNENNNVLHRSSYKSTCVQVGKCTPASSCGFNWLREKNNKCTYQYAHSYAIKDISILVKIKDTKYNITDSAGQQKNPVMNFIVDINEVEDECCNGMHCSSFTNGCSSPFSKLVPVAIPALNIPFDITDVTTEDIAENSATIKWKTTKEATAKLEVWDSGGVLILTINYLKNTIFSQVLAGLKEDEPYSFKITVMDVVGGGIKVHMGNFKTTTLPSNHCKITITVPAVAGALAPNPLPVAATVTCDPKEGDIVFGDKCEFTICNIIERVDRNELLDGPTATYNANMDISSLLVERIYPLRDNFTKNGKEISHETTVDVITGYIVTNDSSVTIIVTDTTATIIYDMNKNGLGTRVLKQDGITDTGIIPVEAPAGTYTINFAGLSHDILYPDNTDNTKDYYFEADDGITKEPFPFSFRALPKITISTTAVTADIKISTTRAGLIMILKDHLGVNVGAPIQVGNDYTFSFVGLLGTTRYPDPDPTKFYNLTMDDGSYIWNKDDICFITN